MRYYRLPSGARHIVFRKEPRVCVRWYSAPSDSAITVQHHPAPHSGSIRVLLLDRPATRNALSRQLVSELTRHVNEIQAEGGTGGTRALIIASNGDKAFCSGADLKERKSMSLDEYVFF